MVSGRVDFSALSKMKAESLRPKFIPSHIKLDITACFSLNNIWVLVFNSVVEFYFVLLFTCTAV